jgi:hypothetical protein
MHATCGTAKVLIGPEQGNLLALLHTMNKRYSIDFLNAAKLLLHV